MLVTCGCWANNCTYSSMFQQERFDCSQQCSAKAELNGKQSDLHCQRDSYCPRHVPEQSQCRGQHQQSLKESSSGNLLACWSCQLLSGAKRPIIAEALLLGVNWTGLTSPLLSDMGELSAAMFLAEGGSRMRWLLMVLTECSFCTAADATAKSA